MYLSNHYNKLIQTPSHGKQQYDIAMGRVCQLDNYSSYYHCYGLYLFSVRLMLELGYRPVPDTQSRAASALPLGPTSPVPEEVGPTEEEMREKVERESQEKLVALSIEHMEEMKRLQHQYE